jgi:hypothetical protein
LLAPLAVPFLALPFGANAMLAVLMLSLVFGGIQYAIFALCLSIVIGHMRSTPSILRLVCWAPIIFVSVQALGWLAYSVFQRLQHPEMSGIWEELLPGTVYALLIGYPYALLVHAGFALLSKFGPVNSVNIGET